MSLLSPGVTNTPGFGPCIRDDELRARSERNKKRNSLDPRAVAEQVCYLLSLEPELCVDELVVQPNPAWKA
ncbi:MAG: hypothetical protein GEU93_04620 [Propionibacteriales bacterium]|nr:hypothetical protein [Propionibacteriales bacterium]